MSEARETGVPGEARSDAWTDRREVRTTASPDAAWRAFGDATIVQGWFADEAECVPGDGREPVPSGAVTAGGEPAAAGDVIVHRFPAFGLETRHEVIEAEPGKRLLLRVSFPGRPPMTQEILIRSDAGETVIEMTNSGFGGEDWDGQWAGIDSGWRLALSQLRYYLENYFGRRRRCWLVMRPAAFEWHALTRLHRSGDLLSRWLTAPDGRAGAADIGSCGSAVRLALVDRGPLSGRVLEDSGKELLLSWPELDGTLELKAFQAGPSQRMIALRVSSWAETVPDGIESWMTQSLDRLASQLGLHRQAAMEPPV